MAETKKLIEIARDLNELYKIKKAALPYSINAITELHAGENANSRILRGLLQYSRNGKYTILQSFIERLRIIADCEIDISIKAPEMTNEEGNKRGRIDLLIKEKKSYAIIIENKIWDACDQDEQIEKYIDYVDGLGIPRRKVYVIYLTRDGNKEISDESLTDTAKKYLEYSHRSNGRFICMNFKDDILPWLDTLKDLEEIKNEPLLSSSITLYIDYLKEIFDAREEDLAIEKELEEQLMDKLQVSSLQDLLQTWEDVSKLEDTVCKATNKRIKSICEKKICRILEKKGYHVRTYDFQYDYFDLEVDIPGWEKCWWAIESDKNKLFSGVWRNPEKRVAKKYISMLNDVFDHSDDGYIGWNWHNDYELNDDFWLMLESHSTKFVNFVINEIERVRKETKNIKL